MIDALTKVRLALSRRRSVELVSWAPPMKRNFGDTLSSVIVHRLLSLRGLCLSSPAQPCRLLAIGSILHFARDQDVIWGSGVNGKIDPQRHRFRSLDVRCVRGPRTREFLRSRRVRCPEVYGDPALLTPLLFPELLEAREERNEYIVVPNLNEWDLVRSWNNVVSPKSEWFLVALEILRSRLVVSSSLHGLVLADAFGVPSRMLRISERESEFKFQDYYEGTGRPGYEAADSIESALAMGPEKPAVVDLVSLLDAFPFDLWSS